MLRLVPLIASSTAGCSVGSLGVAGLISRIYLSRKTGKLVSMGTGEARCAEVSEMLLLLVLHSLLFLQIDFLCERPLIQHCDCVGNCHYSCQQKASWACVHEGPAQVDGCAAPVHGVIQDAEGEAGHFGLHQNAEVIT